MNVFITGASGFIGGRLVGKLLEDNHKLTILIRDPLRDQKLASAGVKTLVGDLSDKEILKSGMEDCDWVFHLAAHVRPVSSDPGLPFITNVTGTLNVLEAAREQSVRKIIITSTA
ncbi:MAG: NAD-dependent epimerase/dehydratase family protein, partial [Bacteroidota bacterium]|nr:NAD-dependent epimerase/dehydratase family protein [Bacteroidota bacterium]